MKCEIIAVGTELLLGNILNTNAKYLSEKLAALGIDVYYHAAVGDNKARVTETIKKALERSDIIITTGGLGPTDDDLTKEGAAAALNLKIVPHQASIDKIEQMFKDSQRPMAACNLKQGYIPEGAAVLQNNNGTAPGVIIEKNGKSVILLPGPPKEMTLMFEQYVEAYLKAKSNCLMKSKTIKVVGIGESAIQEMLQDIFDEQSNPTIAPYAKDGEVHLRVTAKCQEEAEADKLITAKIEQIKSRLGDHIYGYDDDTLEYVVYRLLKNKGLTISTAESCTGGMIAARLTNVSGVSAVFMNTIVTYGNEAKMRFLHVQADTLKNYGAVSSETAEEMAKGIQAVSNTDVGISVTGIAGPDGGSPEKPVGLFYIGIAIGDKVYSKRFLFPGSRERVRNNAVIRALDTLRRELLL